MNQPKKYSIDELIEMPSERLLWIMDECRQECANMMVEMTEAICTHETLQTMLPHKLAKIVVTFLDKGLGRNEALDRAKASDEYHDELVEVSNSFDRMEPLKLRFAAMQNNLKCITSIAYLKNTELKNGV